MPRAATSSSASSSGACSVVGIRPVRQQREVQLAVGRGEVVDLEAVDLLVDRPRASSAAPARRPACAAPRARRRAARGRAGRLAPTPRVTARLTSATATSIAGISAEQRRAATACRRAMPRVLQQRPAASSSTSAAVKRDRARCSPRAPTVKRDAARPVAQRRADSRSRSRTARRPSAIR